MATPLRWRLLWGGLVSAALVPVGAALASAQDPAPDPKPADGAKPDPKKEAELRKAEDKERAAKVRELCIQYAKTRPDQLATVLEEIGKIPHLAAVAFLKGQATGYTGPTVDIQGQVRQYATKALWGQRDKKRPEIAKAAVAALQAVVEEPWNRKEPPGDGAVRWALEGLGELKDASAVKFLIETVDHQKTYWAEAAIVALEKLRDKSSIEPIIKEWCNADGEGRKSNANDIQKERRKVLGDAAGRTLAGLTGQNFEDPLKWQQWWNKNKATFTLPKPVGGDEEAGSSQGS